MGAITALAGAVLGPYIPGDIPTKIGADAVDDLLDIVAASMLAVTTFSLSIMVASYSAATNSVTPRATKLLMDDSTTQNVLGVFIGSFLYSLVGIISLSAGFYGDRGRVVVYVVTIGVIILIVGTLLRWIDHLSRLGRLGETTARVEQAALKAMLARVDNPYLGGRPLRSRNEDIPPGAVAVFSPSIGYVRHIDIGALSDGAAKHDAQVFVLASPGAFVDPTREIARIWRAGDELEEFVAEAFEIGAERSFDQDPRFGLSVLAEIASRALSPAVNDPGTAIDILGRAVRVMTMAKAIGDPPVDYQPPCPNVWVEPILAQDMFDDLFTPIARDGASIVEVHTRLQKALLSLSRAGGGAYRLAASAQSEWALERALQGLDMERDRERIRSLAAQFH